MPTEAWHVTDTATEFRTDTGEVLGEIRKLRLGGYKWEMRRRPGEDPSRSGPADSYSAAMTAANEAWNRIRKEAKEG